MLEISSSKCRIDFVIDSVRNSALSDHGHLVAFFDTVSGEVIDGRPIYEDFGDVAPFLIACGAGDIADREFSALKSELDSSFLYINPRRSRPWMIKTYDWTDLLLGLLDYDKCQPGSGAKELADSLLSIWWGTFGKEDYISGRAIRVNSKKAIAIPMSSLHDIGMFPELLVQRSNVQNETQSMDFLSIATKIVDSIVDDEFTKKYGIFPNYLNLCDRLSPGVSKWFDCLFRSKKHATATTANLFKENTNALASVLAVWEMTGEPKYLKALNHWLDGCLKHMQTPSKMIAMGWNPKKGVIHPPTDHNFQFVDLMCDIYHQTGQERFIESAEAVANTWLQARGSSGFFPHHIEGRYSELAMSDSQTDFSVALLKLSALTNNTSYSTAAEEVLQSISEYMYTGAGMANWVDVHSGKALDGVCKTKFLVLSLKGWFALDNKEKIYKDPDFTALLSDR